MSSSVIDRPAVDAPPDWTFPAVQDGGDTVLCHLPERQLVTAALVLQLPLAVEPLESAGVVATALRCLIEATPDRGGAVLRERLEAIGATVNAQVGYDGQLLTVTSAAERITAAWQHVCDTMAAPRFDLDLVARVLEQDRAAARSREADPSWRARAELQRECVHERSRWSVPAAGTAESLTALEPESIMATALRLSQRTPGVLVASGDVSGRSLPRPDADGDRLLSDALGRERTPTRAVIVDRDNAVQTCLAVGNAAVDRGDPRWADLAVARTVLGGPMWSRLEARLREEMGYTYGIRAAFEPWRRSGLFAIRTAVESSVTGPALIDLLSTVRLFATDGMTAAEHTRARDLLLHSEPMRYETTSAITGHLANLKLAELPLDQLDRERAGMRASTAESADDVFRAVVDPNALVVVAVGDAAQIEPALRDAGVDAVEVRS
jgi:predicted Zn-dependent peptidase